MDRPATPLDDFEFFAAVVVGGVVGRISVQERFEITLFTRSGMESFWRGTLARRVMTREWAAAFLAALAAPGGVGLLPAEAAAVEQGGWKAFDASPDASKVALLRALRLDPASLSPTLRQAVLLAEGSVLDELSFALDRSARELRAIVRRRDGSVAPEKAPRPFAGHDYLGAFQVGGEVLVVDPCNIGLLKKPEPVGTLFTQALPALPGRWHVYVRYDPNFPGVTLSIFGAHEAHLGEAKEAGEDAGRVGVDAGVVALLDGRARAEAGALAGPLEEGRVGDLGYLTPTADGDGVFPVRSVRRDGRAVVVRAGLTGDEGHAYYTPPPPAEYVASVDAAVAAAPARDYSPKATFAAGEHVHHPTFGEGVVDAVLPGNKVSIAFRDGVRSLVHGRK